MLVKAMPCSVRLMGMFERRWFTNDGPLVREFARAVQAQLRVKHCVETVAPALNNLGRAHPPIDWSSRIRDLRRGCDLHTAANPPS